MSKVSAVPCLESPPAGEQRARPEVCGGASHTSGSRHFCRDSPRRSASRLRNPKRQGRVGAIEPTSSSRKPQVRKARVDPAHHPPDRHGRAGVVRREERACEGVGASGMSTTCIWRAWATWDPPAPRRRAILRPVVCGHLEKTGAVSRSLVGPLERQ